jgi:hypothetical protein
MSHEYASNHPFCHLFFCLDTRMGMLKLSKWRISKVCSKLDNHTKCREKLERPMAVHSN